jgi:hypothetical protein
MIFKKNPRSIFLQKKMAIDLNNFKNMFLISSNCASNCETEEIKGLNLVKNTVLNQTLQSFLYTCGTDLVLTFTPFNPQDLQGLLVGVKLWYYQNMIRTQNGDINKFFYDNALLFYNDLKSYIHAHFTKYTKSRLYITGISMGGALSQAFFYHIKNLDKKIIITTFGSPRIGDVKLRDWFCQQKNLKISNYALFKKFGLYKKVDPVITFPHRNKTQLYVNNANLLMIYNKVIKKNVDCHIDQPDISITIPSLIKRLFVSCELDKYWEDIHNIDEYYESIF